MIESAANPKLKHLKKLLLSRKYRYQHQSYVIETQHGLNELLHYSPHHLKQLFLRDTTSADSYQSLDTPIFHVKGSVFDTIATINGTTCLAIVKMNTLSFPDAVQTILYCDGVQIPANLGAIIRNMVAFNYNALALSNESCDPYHPESVRAAAGTLIHLTIQRLNFNELNTRYPNLSYYALAANRGQSIYTHSIKTPAIIVVGAEKGLSPTLTDQLSEKNYRHIPISDRVESLNVAVTVGIVLAAI